MVFDFNKFDVQDTADRVGGVLSSALRTIDRPRGAVNAFLQGKDISEGFNNPEQYHGSDLFGIKNIDNPTVKGIVGGAADILTDPVNIGLALVPFGGEAAIAGRVGARVAGEETTKGLISGALKRVATNSAYGIGGRASQELTSSVLSNTDLPQPVKDIASTAAGFIGPILGSRVASSLRGGIDNAARVTEEQLNKTPSYLDYLDTVTANDGIHVLDKQGNTLHIASDVESARDWAHANVEGSAEQFKIIAKDGSTVYGPVSAYVVGGVDKLQELANNYNGTLQRVTTPMVGQDYSLKKIDTIRDLIAQNTMLEYDVPIGHSASEPLMERNVNIIPSERAPKDILLDDSHQQYTTSFNNFANTNPDAHHALSNWIGSSSGEAGSVLRNAFINGDEKIARPIDSLGEEWRQWTHKQDTPFIQNGMVYLYRGESNYISKKLPNSGIDIGESIPINPKDYPVASWTTDPEAAANFAHTTELTNPYNGSGARTNFILGKWVPIDDVIAPVGGQSTEHEFLVMDRTQIPDEVYKSLRGTDKTVPLGTTKYAIINPRTGETLRYVDTEAEAIKATENPINETKYNVVTKATSGISDEAVIESFDNRQDAENYLKTFPYDNVNLKIEQSVINTDYQPVVRGFEPKVNIANAQPTDPLAQEPYGYKDKFLGMFGDNAPIAKAVEGDIGSRDLQSKLFDEMVPVPKQIAGDELANNIIDTNEPVLASGAGGQLPPNKPPTDGTPPVEPTPSNSDDLHNIQNDSAKANNIDPTIGPLPSNLPPDAQQSTTDALLNKMGASNGSQQLVDLITQGMQRAGKTDQSTIGKVQGIMRTLWATGDGSWLGIQGLLTVPRLLLKGDFADAKDLVNVSLMALAGDSTAMGHFLQRTIDTLPKDAPSILEAQKAGLHLAFLQGSVADVDFNFGGLLNKIPVVGGALQNSENAFLYAGDVARITMFYNEWRRYGNEGNIQALATAINRATGIAAHPFGGHIGTFALFAPKFFQSQLETVIKAVSDGTIEGTLARRQLMSMIGTGVLLTGAANYVRGEDTEYNPLSSNFMRIRNVGGADISVFGPWDSLVKLVSHMGSGAYKIATGDQQGGQQDLSYARSKFSPILDLATNLMTGKTFLGEDFYDPTVLAKSMLLPFAWQNIGREPAVSTAVGFFGVKSSALSATEIIDQNMQNLGLDPKDPLSRRQYLADNPQQKNLFSDAQKKAALVTADVGSRALLNDNSTLNNEQTLKKFKDNRTILAREQRDKLEVLLGNNSKPPVTQQDKWINSYYQMFNGARDPITHDINGPQLDELQANWVAQNGQDAFDYMQRYQLVGKNPVESKYLQDMLALREIGYFGTPKYQPIIYRSGLTDNQITDYRDKVSAARSADPTRLGKMTFAGASHLVLNSLTPQQIQSIDLAGNSHLANPKIDQLKQQYPSLFVWFNPNSKWENLQVVEKRNKLPIPSLALAPVGSR